MDSNVTLTTIAIIIFLLLVTVSVIMAANQKKKVVEWLKYAVSMAEKELGEKTGQLKLRRVYDWFIEKFPFLSSLITFNHFSKWVDIAIKTLDNWIDSKNEIANYICNSDKKSVKTTTKKPKSE